MTTANRAPNSQNGSPASPHFRTLWKRCVPEEFQSVTLYEVGEINQLTDTDRKLFRDTVRETIGDLTGTEPRGLFLAGSVGIGKTAALYVILKHWLWAWSQACPLVEIQVQFLGYGKECVQREFERWVFSAADYAVLTHGRMVDILREHAAARKENPNLGQIPEILLRRCLFIDDLARGYDDRSGWHVSMQFEVFNHRWEHHLPTFVTTNKNPDELRSWDDWEAIVDRLCDPNWNRKLHIEGTSRRKV